MSDKPNKPGPGRAKTSPMASWEKVAVMNVLKHLEETWPKNSYPYKCDIINKTAAIMGISRATVNRIIKEKKTTGRLKSPPPPSPRVSMIDTLSDKDLNAIRRKVHTFYVNNEVPSVDRILEAVNSDESLPNFKRTTFYKLLMKHC